MDWDRHAEKLIERFTDPFVIAAIGGFVVTVLGFILNWIKQNRTEKKIDQNTQITKIAERNVTESMSEAVHKVGSDVKFEAKKDAVRLVAVGMAEVARKAEVVATAATSVATATTDKLEEVSKAINGRMTQHIEEAKKAAFAAGMLAGKKAFEEQGVLIRALEQQQITINERLERHAKKNEEHNKMLHEKLDSLLAKKVANVEPVANVV